MEITYSLTNPQEEPKHLKGLDNVQLLYGHGYLRKITISSNCVSKGELLGYGPLPDSLPYQLGTDDKYRILLDDNGRNIGWVSLDEEYDELHEVDYSAATIASEEAWIVNDMDPLDSLYKTHPPSPKFEAFAATDKCAAEYERLREENPLPEILMSRSKGERVLAMTFWVLLLTPDVYTRNDSTETIVYWKRVGWGRSLTKLG